MTLSHCTSQASLQFALNMNVNKSCHESRRKGRWEKDYAEEVSAGPVSAFKRLGEPEVCPLPGCAAMALPKATFPLGKSVIRPGGSYTSAHQHWAHRPSLGQGSQDRSPVSLWASELQKPKGGAAAAAEPQTAAGLGAPAWPEESARDFTLSRCPEISARKELTSKNVLT